jgi:hypothetical protein
MIMLPHHFLDRFCRFLRMVERNGGYEMVDHMSSHDVVEEVGIDKSKIAIDGSCSTSRKSPLGVSEMR